MKKSLLVIGFAFASFATVSAYSLNNNAVMSVVGEDKKVELEAAKFPATLVTSVTKAYPNAKIEKVFELKNEKGELNGYEVIVNVSGKSSTVSVDKNGMVAATPVTTPAATTPATPAATAPATTAPATTPAAPAVKVDSVKAK